jgi:hypothetical protein
VPAAKLNTSHGPRAARRIAMVISPNHWSGETKSAHSQGGWPMPDLQERAMMLVVRDNDDSQDLPLVHQARVSD